MHSEKRLITGSKLKKRTITIWNTMKYEYTQKLMDQYVYNMPTKQSTMLLITMKTKALPSKSTITLRVNVQFSGDTYDIHEMLYGEDIAFVSVFVQLFPYYPTKIRMQDNAYILLLNNALDKM